MEDSDWPVVAVLEVLAGCGTDRELVALMFLRLEAFLVLLRFGCTILCCSVASSTEAVAVFLSDSDLLIASAVGVSAIDLEILNTQNGVERIQLTFWLGITGHDAHGKQIFVNLVRF